MKLIQIIFVLFGVFLTLLLVSFAQAGEIEDLQSRKNQIALERIRTETRLQMLHSQLDEYLSNYVKKRNDYENTVKSLVKQSNDIDRQIKALETKE